MDLNLNRCNEVIKCVNEVLYTILKIDTVADKFGADINDLGKTVG